MSTKYFFLKRLILWAFILLGYTLNAQPTKPTLRYTGSSTIAHFIEEAAGYNPWANFKANTEAESKGGESAVISGLADIGGVAHMLDTSSRKAGPQYTLIGYDAIAVIANTSDGIKHLTTQQLKMIFTGQVDNWKSFGGSDLPIKPFIVGMESATRNVFRAAILGEANYSGYQVVRPDAAMLKAVSSTPGAIGHISTAFLNSSTYLKTAANLTTLSIDGYEPGLGSSYYPITRPLYLLWWPRRSTKRFIEWVKSPEGQSIAQKHFMSAAVPPGHPLPTIQYVGSPFLSQFLAHASKTYRQARIAYDTLGNNRMGEARIREDASVLVGITKVPDPATLQSGVVAARIGFDHIAMITNTNNPIHGLTFAQLQAIFSGNIKNWKELGGLNGVVKPYTFRASSEIEKAFTQQVLTQGTTQNATVVGSAAEMVEAIRKDPLGIGFVSVNHLNQPAEVKALVIEGENPVSTNPDYPITRPLYLLWREGNPTVEAFAEWSQSVTAQRVLMNDFVAVKNTPSRENIAEKGTLIVYTKTFPVEDGGAYYYPHHAYEAYDAQGQLVKRVHNHTSPNDETPTPVQLPVGKYKIVPEQQTGKAQPFFVDVVGGKTSKIYVDNLQNNQVTTNKRTAPPTNEREKLVDELLAKFKSLRFFGDFRLILSLFKLKLVPAASPVGVTSSSQNNSFCFQKGNIFLPPHHQWFLCRPLI